MIARARSFGWVAPWACALVVLVAGVGEEASASPSGRYPRCRHYKCVTLAATSQLVVVQAKTHRFTEIEYQSTFVRWLASGRVTRLGDELPGPDLGITMRRLALAGRYLAYALELSSGRSPSKWEVCRLDARAGHKQCVNAGADTVRPFPSPGGGALSLVTTPRGSVAWVAPGAEEAPTIKGVLMLEPGAKAPKLLASGPNIDSSSLASVPGHLYWTEAGAPRTAAIP